MVWGGNTVPGRSDLHVVAGRVTGQYYRDNIFSLHAVPSACFYDHCFILKDRYRLSPTAKYRYITMTCTQSGRFPHQEYLGHAWKAATSMVITSCQYPKLAEILQ
jgi:hypothetical protein